MKNIKGFTLIEMLVVIAVIGILSATVLTALGPARNKAKDTRIISALQQGRTIVETTYDGSTGAYTVNAAPFTDARLTATAQDITNNNSAAAPAGSLGTAPGGVANSRFELHAKLNDGITYCVDSSGFGGTVSTSTPASGICQ